MPDNEWHQISNLEDDFVEKALSLLKDSATGYDDLSKEVLLRKMRPGEFPKTHCFNLRLFSFGNRADPKISAFFFLRRRTKPGRPDDVSGPNRNNRPYNGPWRYSLSVGAKDAGDAGGLTSADLRDALIAVCNQMKGITPNMKLEILHLPSGPPVDESSNLKDVYDELLDNVSARPPKYPRFKQGTIRLDRPWVRKGESEKEFRQLEILLGP